MTRVFKPDSGQALEIQDEGGSAALTIETDGNVTVDAANLIIGTAGKGIDFSNQASPAAGMTSELLDSYEEGTWSPTFGGVGGDPTGVGYTNTNGTYTKVGDTVLCQVSMSTSTIGVVGSGNVKIKGLPFNARNTTGLDSAFGVYAYSFGSNNNPIVARVNYNTDFITLHKFDTGSAATTGTHYAVDAATMPTSASTNVIKACFSYKV
tara:strand:+ start:11 stop:634 length:624 start_codon:yes stop_codon:yes gene_type:complete